MAAKDWPPSLETKHGHVPVEPKNYGKYKFRIERSLEVKLPTTWTDGRAEVGRVREEKPRSEKIREGKE